MEELVKIAICHFLYQQHIIVFKVKVNIFAKIARGEVECVGMIY